MEANRSSKNPWGHFMGTWQKPRKPIQLKITTKLMAQKARFADSKLKETSPSPLQSIDEQNEQLESNGNELNKLSDDSKPPTSQEPSRQSTSSERLGSSKSTHSQDPISLSGTQTPESRPCCPSPSGTPMNGSRPTSVQSQKTESRSRGSFSGASSRILSAPVSGRSSHVGSRINSASACSQRTSPSNLKSVEEDITEASRPYSREGMGQRSALSTPQGTRVYTPSSTGSRPYSSGSIALTTSSYDGNKSRGVQCPSKS